MRADAAIAARARILSTLRTNRPAGAHPLPDLPDFPLDDGGDRTGHFLAALRSMGGKVFDGRPDAVLAARFPDAKQIASTVPEVAGNRDLAAIGHPRDLADIDVAIARALFAIAETGTVALPDTLLGVNAMAYLAQHLIVLVDPADILPTVQAAYRRPEMAAHAYLAFHSGPSATADIEGVLIHGAQGVRSLTVVLAGR